MTSRTALIGLSLVAAIGVFAGLSFATPESPESLSNSALSSQTSLLPGAADDGLDAATTATDDMGEPDQLAFVDDDSSATDFTPVVEPGSRGIGATEDDPETLPPSTAPTTPPTTAPATTGSTTTGPTTTTVLPSTTPSPPAPSGQLIGIHIDDVPFDGLSLLDPVEAAIGPVEIVHWYQAWGAGHAAFRSDWLDTVAASGRTGLLTWEPWALTGEASQPAFSPAAILAGDHDDYIAEWADGFAARADGPWYLRPMHEMNGNWYPWSGGVPDGDPVQYIEAWRYLHTAFEEAGAANVEWVWCPLVDDISGRFEDYYPGNDVVDVLCLDGYNWGSTDPAYGGWRSVGQVFDAAYARIAALGPQPIWLGEVGSAPEGGDKVAWIAELLAPDRFPRVEATVFFNLDKERDWRIDADPEVAEAVRTHR